MKQRKNDEDKNVLRQKETFFIIYFEVFNIHMYR